MDENGRLQMFMIFHCIFRFSVFFFLWIHYINTLKSCVLNRWMRVVGIVQEISADFHGKTANLDERMPVAMVVAIETRVDFGYGHKINTHKIVPQTLIKHSPAAHGGRPLPMGWAY